MNKEQKLKSIIKEIVKEEMTSKKKLTEENIEIGKYEINLDQAKYLWKYVDDNYKVIGDITKGSKEFWERAVKKYHKISFEDFRQMITIGILGVRTEKNTSRKELFIVPKLNYLKKNLSSVITK